MVDVRVYSKRRGVKLPRNTAVINVDRRSRLGNPFVMGVESERGAVCAAHAEWLFGRAGAGLEELSGKYGVDIDDRMLLVDRAVVLARLDELVEEIRGSGVERVGLLCWCAPRRCHGDVLARYIRRRLLEVGGAG